MEAVAVPASPRSAGARRQSSALEAASLELLREIFRIAPIGIGIVAMDGTAVLTNDALREMLGYSEEEFATLPFDVFTHPDDIAVNHDLFEELAAGRRERFELDKRFFHRDGHLVWGRLLSSLLRDEDGNPTLAVGMLQDVTEEKRLQAELESAEATYRMLVEQVPAVVYVADIDPAAPWSYVSPRIVSLLGFSVEECTKTPGLWIAQIDVLDRSPTIARVEALVRSGSHEPLTLTYRMRRRDGSLVWVRDQFALAEEADGRRVLRGVMVDATREKELEAELEHQAFHDPLTQLANLRLFRERVADRMHRRPPAAGAVIFIDLDDFKLVNDTLGHGAGDRLLQHLADRIRRCLRPADTAGRMGGDEFAILIDEVADRDDALAVAARLERAVTEPVLLDGHRISPSGSFGLAMLGDADSTDDALRAADLAMYRAKDNGKGQVVAYEPEMLTAALARLDRGA